MDISLSANEAEKVYHAIFRNDVPASIQHHFNLLSRKIESRYSRDEINRYYKALQKNCDLEALEIASRYLKKMPVLSEKIKIMVYLAETVPENYGSFVNEHSSFVRACILLFSSMIRTAYKFVKGVMIITLFNI